MHAMALLGFTKQIFFSLATSVFCCSLSSTRNGKRDGNKLCTIYNVDIGLWWSHVHFMANVLHSASRARSSITSPRVRRPARIDWDDLHLSALLIANKRSTQFPDSRGKANILMQPQRMLLPRTEMLIPMFGVSDEKFL